MFQSVFLNAAIWLTVSCAQKEGSIHSQSSGSVVNIPRRVGFLLKEAIDSLGS